MAISHLLKDLSFDLHKAVDAGLFFMYHPRSLGVGQMKKTGNYWEKVAETVNEELSELYAARDNHTAELETLNERIFERERVLTSLQPLTAKADEALKPSPVKVDGIRERVPLAEAIRMVLQAVQTFQTARAIRDVLEASGFDVTGHSNFLASVHGVLKRFLESGEVVKIDSHGKTVYRIARLKPSRATRGQHQSATELLVRELTTPKRAESAVDQMIEQVEDASRKKRNSFVSTIEELGKPKKD
jgi:hypothetical protein